MFSGVTSVSPVEILASTGCFSRYLTIVLTLSLPMRIGILHDQALDLPLRMASTSGSLASKPTKNTGLEAAVAGNEESGLWSFEPAAARQRHPKEHDPARAQPRKGMNYPLDSI